MYTGVVDVRDVLSDLVHAVLPSSECVRIVYNRLVTGNRSTSSDLDGTPTSSSLKTPLLLSASSSTAGRKRNFTYVLGPKRPIVFIMQPGV